MHPIDQHNARVTRRTLLGRAGLGLGAAALASLLNPDLFAAAAAPTSGSAPRAPHFAPKAKRIIYLFQSGGPSHLDLFDYKPKLDELFGQDLPPSVRMGQRLTGMTSGQANFPMIPSKFKFAQHG